MIKQRAWELPQQLNLTVLAENLGLVPATNMIAHNCQKLHFYGIWLHTHTHTRVSKTLIKHTIWIQCTHREIGGSYNNLWSWCIQWRGREVDRWKLYFGFKSGVLTDSPQVVSEEGIHPTPLCLSNLASGLGGWATERGTGLTVISVLEFHTDRKMICSGLKCEVRWFSCRGSTWRGRDGC